jgi:hypothetical protein
VAAKLLLTTPLEHFVMAAEKLRQELSCSREQTSARASAQRIRSTMKSLSDAPRGGTPTYESREIIRGTRRFRLNGWQRIGIVLSAAWALLGGILGWLVTDPVVERLRCESLRCVLLRGVGQRATAGRRCNIQTYAHPHRMAARLRGYRPRALDKGWLQRCNVMRGRG